MELHYRVSTSEGHGEDADHDDAGDVDEAGALGLDKLEAEVEGEVFGVAGGANGEDILCGGDGVEEEETADDDSDEGVADHAVELHGVAFVIEEFTG